MLPSENHLFLSVPHGTGRGALEHRSRYADALMAGGSFRRYVIEKTPDLTPLGHRHGAALRKHRYLSRLCILSGYESVWSFLPSYGPGLLCLAYRAAGRLLRVCRDLRPRRIPAAHYRYRAVSGVIPRLYLVAAGRIYDPTPRDFRPQGRKT